VAGDRSVSKTACADGAADLLRQGIVARALMDHRINAEVLPANDAQECRKHDPEKWIPVFREDHAQKDRAG
jgi:hypothetical protein